MSVFPTNFLGEMFKMLNFRTLLSCLLVLAIVAYGLPAHSQVAETPQPRVIVDAQGIVDAQTDAAANANQLMWLGGTFAGTSLVGCLFCGLPAIIAASIYEPAPPAHRLIGKSPEYVMAYQTTYKEAIKSHQTRNATIGCLGGSVVAGIVGFIYYSGQQ